MYVLRMMPDGIADVLTSANARAGVPSAKKRLPAPNRDCVAAFRRSAIGLLGAFGQKHSGKMSNLQVDFKG